MDMHMYYTHTNVCKCVSACATHCFLSVQVLCAVAVISTALRCDCAAIASHCRCLCIEMLVFFFVFVVRFYIGGRQGIASH